MIAWCLERAPEDPPPRPHYPEAGLPAEEASARLKAEMAAAVGAAVAWRATATEGEAPPVVGIKAGAGLGKTGCALEQIAAVPGSDQMNLEIYVPTQALADRARATAPHLRVLVVKGRGSVDPNGEPMCQKSDLAEQVAKAGLNVMAHLCREGMQWCEFAAGCVYLRQFRDTSPALRIMAHAAMFVPRNQDMPAPDLVVIDEAFWQGSLVHQRLALDRLTEAGRWRAQPKKLQKRMQAKAAAAKEALAKALDKLKAAASPAATAKARRKV